MKIRSIRKIPRFIGEYFNEGILTYDDINEFSKLLVTLDYTLIDDTKLTCILDCKPKFIDFYLDKSKLDKKYICKYEEELDIPKSIYNEIYTVELIYGGTTNVSLDYDEECNCLILNIEV